MFFVLTSGVCFYFNQHHALQVSNPQGLAGDVTYHFFLLVPGSLTLRHPPPPIHTQTHTASQVFGDWAWKRKHAGPIFFSMFLVNCLAEGFREEMSQDSSKPALVRLLLKSCNMMLWILFGVLVES